MILNKKNWRVIMIYYILHHHILIITYNKLIIYHHLPFVTVIILSILRYTYDELTIYYSHILDTYDQYYRYITITAIISRTKRSLSTLCKFLHTYKQKLNKYYFKVPDLHTQS